MIMKNNWEDVCSDFAANTPEIWAVKSYAYSPVEYVEHLDEGEYPTMSGFMDWIKMFVYDDMGDGDFVFEVRNPGQ
jgi:hypothetical protein